MKCYICESENFIPVLDKEPISIWSGSCYEATVPYKVECKLFQCLECGHIQQNMTERLGKSLIQIYKSEHAQASTAIGKGNWGQLRARQILQELDLKTFKSALEIGCADGYILKYLKRLGFKDLVGIEPSISGNYEENGIRFVREFVTPSLKLNKKFDFIFSICVFEHIKYINDVMEFVRNHLKKGGVLFFEVPNFHAGLQNGDPAVFMHEHVHNYVKSSLNVLLERNGFRARKIKEIRDSYFVYAQRKNNFDVPEYETHLYDEYSSKLNSVIERLSKIARENRIAFHGINNALNNIIGWGELNSDFGLFDNDETKNGMKYFGKCVYLPNKEMVDRYECIVIVPAVYFEEIKSQYENLGFRGNIIKACDG